GHLAAGMVVSSAGSHADSGGQDRLCLVIASQTEERSTSLEVGGDIVRAALKERVQSTKSVVVLTGAGELHRQYVAEEWIVGLQVEQFFELLASRFLTHRLPSDSLTDRQPRRSRRST